MSSRAKLLSRIGRRGFVSVLVATIAVALGATFAFAFWTTTGTGTASAATGTLNAPTVQQPTATGGTVQVSWTAPTSGVAPAGYYLTRTNTAAATTVAACNTSVGSLTTATSCTDTSVPSGTYTYAVTAVYHSWTAKGTSPSVTVNAATKLALTSSPVSGSASTSASLGPITVQLQDANGNAATNSSATTVHLSSNSAGSVVFATSANGTSVTSVTIPLGSSSASFYYGDTKASSPTITATASSLTAATQQETITAGPAKTLSASSGDHQSATVSTAFGTALGAKVVDANGNPVSGVTVTFAAPSTGASGRFGDSGTATTTATTGVNGVATAATFTANTVAGSYVINATVAVSGTNTTTFSLTNTAGSAKNLNTNTNTTPQSATVGSSFGTALGVTVTDANGNAVSGVTVTFTAPASGASGKFADSGTAATTATTNGSGVATASAFTANTTAGAYTVSATVAAPNASAASFALTNNAGPARNITPNSNTTPQSALINTQFTTSLAVTVTDANSNPVPGVTVTFSAPASGASGKFGSATVTTATTSLSGVAIASTFTANGTVGSYVVNASVSGVSPGATFALTNNPPPTIPGNGISPASIAQGASATMTIVGSGFQANASLTLTPAGISVSDVTVRNSTTITATVSVASSVATTAKPAVTVTNPDGGSATKGNAFAITAGPQVASISPSSIAHGTSSTIVTINGSGFSSTTSIGFSNSGITTGTVTFVNGSQIKVSVAVSTGVPAGTYDVTVTNTDGGTSTKPGALTVT